MDHCQKPLHFNTNDIFKHEKVNNIWKTEACFHFELHILKDKSVQIIYMHDHCNQNSVYKNYVNSVIE